MMNRFLATLFIIILTFMNALGNYWFTFGLWPRSWSAFFFFLITGTILIELLKGIMKE